MNRGQEFIPALRFHALTPLYDFILSTFFAEAAIKEQVATRVARAGTTVLDLGVGTGTLSLLLRQRQHGGLVTGVDIDGAVLARAQAKSRAGQLAVALVQGSADTLPYADASVDCVVSTLVFHHLSPAVKQRAMQEVYRVLRPGGRFVLADFGPPETWFAAGVAVLVRHLEEVDGNLRGLLPEFMRAAEFAAVKQWGSAQTLLGTVVFLEAIK